MADVWYEDEDALKLSDAENQVQLSLWLKPLEDWNYTFFVPAKIVNF